MHLVTVGLFAERRKVIFHPYGEKTPIMPPWLTSNPDRQTHRQHRYQLIMVSSARSCAKKLMDKRHQLQSMQETSSLNYARGVQLAARGPHPARDPF